MVDQKKTISEAYSLLKAQIYHKYEKEDPYDTDWATMRTGNREFVDFVLVQSKLFETKYVELISKFAEHVAKKTNGIVIVPDLRSEWFLSLKDRWLKDEDYQQLLVRIRLPDGNELPLNSKTLYGEFRDFLVSDLKENGFSGFYNPSATEDGAFFSQMAKELPKGNLMLDLAGASTSSHGEIGHAVQFYLFTKVLDQALGNGFTKKHLINFPFNLNTLYWYYDNYPSFGAHVYIHSFMPTHKRILPFH